MTMPAPVRWLLPIAALAQVFGAWWPAGAGLGQSVAERSAVVTTPVTPAGYAFSIWGVIFFAALALALWQLFTEDEDEREVAPVRLPFALACAADAAWEIYVQFRGIDLVSVVVIFVGLAAAVVAVARASQAPVGRITRPGLLLLAPTGLLAGWLSVAAFANLGAVFERAGVSFEPEGTAAASLLAIACLIAALLVWRARARPWIAAAAAWGLVAVIVRNGEDGGSSAALIAAGLGLAGVALALVAGEMRPVRRRGY